MSTLVRFSPDQELNTLQGEVNRLFDTFFGGSSRAAGPDARVQRWVPAMDLVEHEDALVLRADLPGLTREDVSLEVKDNALTLSGERKAEGSRKADGFYRVERAFGRFSRSFAVPEGVDLERISASFDNGVLEVRVPKPEERKPHRIEIQTRSGEPALNGSATEVSNN